MINRNHHVNHHHQTLVTQLQNCQGKKLHRCLSSSLANLFILHLRESASIPQKSHQTPFARFPNIRP
jgi:hypothetical protein